MSALPESPDLSETRLAAIKARLDAATPGPWTVDGIDPFHDEYVVRHDGTYIAATGKAMPGDEDRARECRCNAEFIARAPGFVASLLAEVRRLQSALDALATAVKPVQDDLAGDPGDRFVILDRAPVEHLLAAISSLLSTTEAPNA